MHTQEDIKKEAWGKDRITPLPSIKTSEELSEKLMTFFDEMLEIDPDSASEIRKLLKIDSFLELATSEIPMAEEVIRICKLDPDLNETIHAEAFSILKVNLMRRLPRESALEAIKRTFLEN